MKRVTLVLMLDWLLLVAAELNTTTVAVHRNVIGYITASFTPPVLRVRQDNTATGRVRVTVQSHRFADSSYAAVRQPAVLACVVDPSVVTASWTAAHSDRHTDVVSCSSFLHDSTNRPTISADYSVTVRGLLIGRSAVKLYVMKTDSPTVSGVLHDTAAAYSELLMNDDVLIVTTPRHVERSISSDDADIVRGTVRYDADDGVSYARVVCNVTDCHSWQARGTGVTRRWWLADEYQIAVVSPVQRTTSSVLCYIILTLTALNLVGIGGQLDCDEAIQMLRRPSPVAVGLFCRFAVMPAVSSLVY